MRAWIDQLVVQDLLEVTEDSEYPLLRITDGGKAMCRDEKDVVLGLPVPAKIKGAKKSRALKKAAAALRGGLEPDEELFERLRAYRRVIADKAGVPPYVVFHDSVLMEMAAAKPRNLDELRGMKGIGERKLERYGALFLEVVAGHPVDTMELPDVPDLPRPSPEGK